MIPGYLTIEDLLQQVTDSVKRKLSFDLLNTSATSDYISSPYKLDYKVLWLSRLCYWLIVYHRLLICVKG